MASGDVVNTAARLQAAAPTNGILVDETTYRATERAIEYGEARPIDAKGKAEPVAVWEALAARARVAVERVGGASARRTRAGARPSCARRSRASPASASRSSSRSSAFRASARAGSCTSSSETIETGDFGLVFWRHGRSLPYGEGVTFWALGEMVKAQAGILESDGPAEAAAKLRRAVERFVGGRDGGRLGRAAPARRSPGSTSERIDGRPARRGVRGLAPLPGGARRRAPARPRLRGPALGGRRAARLRRLPRRLGERRPAARALHRAPGAPHAAARLGRRQGELVDDPPLPARRGGDRRARTRPARTFGRSTRSSRRRLLEHAGGNPLYAEEFTRMLSERPGRLARARDRPGPHRRPPRHARSARRRSCCCDAAVVGQGLLARSARAASAGRSRSGCIASSAPSSCGASAEAPSRVRSSTASGTRSCATSPTSRSRERSGRRSTARRPSGSSRSAGPTTTPRCSRTTTERRSSTPGDRRRHRRVRGACACRVPRGGRSRLRAERLRPGRALLRAGARALGRPRPEAPPAATARALAVPGDDRGIGPWSRPQMRCSARRRRSARRGACVPHRGAPPAGSRRRGVPSHGTRARARAATPPRRRRRSGS